MTHILVAGIGNIFMGDDGFGCEVVRRLGCISLPDGIDVVDFGIRGMDLGYVLEDGYDLVILVDAIDREGTPGTLHVIEPENAADARDLQLLSPHGMDPASVLRLVAQSGAAAPRIVLVGCVPEWLGGDEGHMGLTNTVASAVDEAVIEVQTILRDALQRSRNQQAATRRTTGNWNREVPGGTT